MIKKRQDIPLTIAAVTAYVDRLEPELHRTVWPPMTYMLISSVLDDTDVFIQRLKQHLETNDEAALRHQLERVEELRRNFRRVA